MNYIYNSFVVTHANGIVLYRMTYVDDSYNYTFFCVDDLFGTVNYMVSICDLILLNYLRAGMNQSSTLQPNFHSTS